MRFITLIKTDYFVRLSFLVLFALKYPLNLKGKSLSENESTYKIVFVTYYSFIEG